MKKKQPCEIEDSSLHAYGVEDKLLQRCSGKQKLGLSMQDKKGLYHWTIMCRRGSGRRQNQIGVNGIRCGRANICVYGQYFA